MKVYVLVNNGDIIGVYNQEDEARKQAIRELGQMPRRSWEDILFYSDLTDKDINLYDFIDDVLIEFDIRVDKVEYFEKKVF